MCVNRVIRSFSDGVVLSLRITRGLPRAYVLSNFPYLDGDNLISHCTGPTDIYIFNLAPNIFSVSLEYTTNGILSLLIKHYSRKHWIGDNCDDLGVWMSQPIQFGGNDRIVPALFS